MITIIILVIIIILYLPCQYLLIEMKWMYLTLYSVNISQIGFCNFYYYYCYFFPFLEREEPDWRCVECQGWVCHKDINCLGERTNVAFSKVTCVNDELSVCVRQIEKMWSPWVHFWSFWKVFLFFIPGVFTVQIVFTTKKPDGHNLIFQVKNVRNVQIGGQRALTRRR